MIRSMTGYGRSEGMLNDRNITVEVHSVNNRYLDCSVKIPRTYVFAEEKLKKAVQEQISRGKVDVFVSIDSMAAEQVLVSVNRPVADGYYEALVQMRNTYRLEDDISVALLSRFPDVFTVEKEQADLEVAGEDIKTVLIQALQDLNGMREQEGMKLLEDIRSRAKRMEELLESIEVKGPAIAEDYRNKLERRLAEVLENVQIDESRLLTEAAIFADKVAVDEELVRLRSHLAQLDDILEEGGIIGRKLDFLVQEFNREVNTIGSKCSDIEITRAVVEMKGEIEKIREQVQNIE